MPIHGTSRKMLNLSSLVVPANTLELASTTISRRESKPDPGGLGVRALYSDSTFGNRDAQSGGNGSADRCRPLARREEYLKGTASSRLAAHADAAFVRLHDTA